MGSENIEVEAGSILSESVINTKTIFSYNMETNVVEFYAKILRKLNKNLVKSSISQGVSYGISQFVIYILYAIMFYAGGKFKSEGTLTFQNMMRAIFTILFSALGVGIAQLFVGDYQAAQKAVVSLYKTLDEPSLIDIAASEEKGIRKANFEGKIEFRNVKFAYPTRPNNLIFKELSFVIQPGKSVAFVGASGSGKSTIIALIERFYDVLDGEILIDDIPIKDYDLKHLRKNIALVAQEPILFQRSIRKNIEYGRLGANNEEIDQAAKDAFIYDLLEKSESKEAPISGGQKQRVAIARAILKNPAILLLDEATSALDKHSEEFVKNSLAKLMENRTSIIIAHR
jgi:ATP-binding cassette subfamily B (MDR/TAP) protein 1